jgi:hypothetical protein
MIPIGDLRRWMTLLERERMCENASLLQITPAFVRAVRKQCNRIAADIADDLPRNTTQFADRILAVVARIEQEEPLGPTMTVVRAELRPADSVSGINSVGAHWSWSEAGARVYHHENAHDEYGHDNLRNIILVAEVPFNSIDWPYTIATNLILPGEQEITILNGATVKLKEIFADTDGNGKMDEWFDPKGRTAHVDGTYDMD